MRRLLPLTNRFGNRITSMNPGGRSDWDIPQSEANALISLYNATGGPSWTNKTNWLTDPVVDNWYGITVTGGHVTQIDLNTNNLVGTIPATFIQQFPNLTLLYLRTNAGLSGSVAGWVLPASLVSLSIYSTSVSGDISGWVLPASLAYFRIDSTSVNGDISGWVLPASLANFRIYSTSVNGDISGWVLPASLVEFFIYSTSVSNAPSLAAGALAIRNYQYQNCSLSQAHVDAVLAAVYAERADVSYATPILNLGANDSVPSGAYADEDPPTTGLGYVYELANDPEVEGFNTWTITYYGGEAP